MIYINSGTRYGTLDFFCVNCVDTCLEVLEDDIIDRVVVNIVPLEQSEFLFEAGGAAHEIKIVDDDFDGSRPPYINEIIAEISVSKDIRKLLGNSYFEKYFRKRFLNFIESTGVKVNMYSIFTIVLLHEIGHCNLMSLFLRLGLGKEFDNLYHLSKTIVRVIGSYELEEKWEKSYRLSLSQTIDLMENYADAYAYRNFLLIWKKVEKFIRSDLYHESNCWITRYGIGVKNKERKHLNAIRQLEFSTS